MEEIFCFAMAKISWKKKEDTMARPKVFVATTSRTDPFSASEWEAIQTIETASRLMDMTPAEVSETTYEGLDDIEPNVDGE